MIAEIREPLEKFAAETKDLDKAPVRGFTEAASEIQGSESQEEFMTRFAEFMRDAAEKRKHQRGRPAFHCGLGLVGKDGKTTRAAANDDFAWWAVKALEKYRGSHPAVVELLGEIGPGTDSPCGPFNTRTWKPGILAELGRLLCAYTDGEEAALQLAVELANMRPRLTSKQAVAWIRNRRLQRVKEGTADDLLGVILRAVDEFIAFNPSTPVNTIRKALGSAVWIYDDEDDEATPESHP